MRRPTSAVLREARAKKTVGFRVDPQLESDIEQLTIRIEKEAPGLTFDKSAIVEQALRRAIDQAHRELDARQSRGPAARGLS